MDSLFVLGLLSHSCSLSPLSTDLEVIILLRATPRGVLMKRALKKLFGTLFTGIGGEMFFFYARSVQTWEFGSFRKLQDSKFHRYFNHEIWLTAKKLVDC